ncbi:leucine-rich repeat protein [uncultured Clostridium sp.]|uniref:leucine-rich repeat domain-containing protein n=1 Tax=uncultured Clostridium sp. TaxID=59620 RepID=UPI00345CD58E
MNIEDEQILTQGSAGSLNYNSLVRLVVSNTILTIKENAFINFKSILKFVEFGNNITTIDTKAFYACNKLTTIDLSVTKITTIGEHAFDNCSNLFYVQFPNTLINLMAYAFSNCSKLNNIDLSKTDVTIIGAYAFYYCSSLSNIKLPINIIELEDGVFYKCAIEDIDLLNIKKIGQSCFKACNFSSIIIPLSVNEIGNDAFYNTLTYGIVNVYMKATIPPNIGTNAFYAKSFVTIYVPQEALSSYESIDNLSGYTIESIDNLSGYTIRVN